MPDCPATMPCGPGTTAVSTHTADNTLPAGYHNCTTRGRAINIICWGAVVVHRTQPYSIPHVHVIDVYF